jgi:hypothetical protein
MITSASDSNMGDDESEAVSPVSKSNTNSQKEHKRNHKKRFPSIFRIGGKGSKHSHEIETKNTC